MATRLIELATKLPPKKHHVLPLLPEVIVQKINIDVIAMNLSLSVGEVTAQVTERYVW